ncbi:MAG: hypothetical protein H0V66_10250 [Bdellovibrionales bacterium]|nr:hypothetical protein [Bdellovibrionales bacterium]
MIKTILIVLLFGVLTACTKQPKTTDFSDDYVLIEFAAKLEEEHLQIYPGSDQPLENLGKKPTE